MSHVDSPSPKGWDPEREQDLWRKNREGLQSARQALIENYLPWSHRIAARVFAARMGDDVEFSEYLQLGCVGLLEAIDRFDEGRGVQFRTFAAYRIEGAIRNGLAKSTEKREQLAWRQRVLRQRAKSIAAAELESEDSLDGAFADLATVAIELAIGYLLEDSGIVSKVATETQDRQYQGRAIEELQGRLAEALEQLPEREQRLLRYHYFGQMGFEELARVFEVSKGRLSQLHRRALGRLRELLDDTGIDGYY